MNHFFRLLSSDALSDKHYLLEFVSNNASRLVAKEVLCITSDRRLQLLLAIGINFAK